MRIVYDDPIAELKSLIAKAEQSDNVSYIAVTSTELKACLEHRDASQVFPRFVNERDKRIAHIHAQMKKIRPMINGNQLTDREKQPFFDKMDVLEEAENKALNQLPKVIREGNMTFKVTMS